MKVIREGHECHVGHLIADLGTIVECEECGRQWKCVPGRWSGTKDWRPVLFRRKVRS
jgi:hypothetical protein